MPNTIADCCKNVTPCEAVCLINNVLIDLVAGRAVTSYRVGEESFQMRPPTLAEARDLLAYFTQLCDASKGVRTRRRASVCFIPGRNECPRCHRSVCAC